MVYNPCIALTRGCMDKWQQWVISKVGPQLVPVATRPSLDISHTQDISITSSVHLNKDQAQWQNVMISKDIVSVYIPFFFPGSTGTNIAFLLFDLFIYLFRKTSLLADINWFITLDLNYLMVVSIRLPS